jgi:hypothetical protein
VKPIRLLVCGNRELDGEAWYRCVRTWLEAVDAGAKRAGRGVVLIHGDAKGADALAGAIGRELGWEIIACPADWAKHGKSAGPRRNREMFALHRPHRALAFGSMTRRGKLTGTGDMVTICNEGACLVTVVPAANVMP